MHTRQQHGWDCGLACCVMVLRALSIHGVSVRDIYAQCTTKVRSLTLPTSACYLEIYICSAAAFYCFPSVDVSHVFD